MRFRTLIVLAALTLLAAVPAHAVGRHEFGVAGGLSMPTGNFGDAAGAGFNIGAQYQYMVTNLGAGVETMYHAWNESDATKQATELAFGPGAETKFSAWQYNAYGVWSLPTPTVTPYAKLGAGWYSPGTKLVAPSGNTSSRDTRFGMSVGGGVDWKLPTGQRLGIGATYHRLKNSDEDFYSVSARMMWPLKLGL